METLNNKVTLQYKFHKRGKSYGSSSVSGHWKNLKKMKKELRCLGGKSPILEDDVLITLAVSDGGCLLSHKIGLELLYMLCVTRCLLSSTKSTSIKLTRFNCIIN